MRNKRFLNRVTTSRLTLPAACLLAVLCWLAGSLLVPACGHKGESPLSPEALAALPPSWAGQLLCLLLCGAIGYLLIELNNRYAIIRMRASVQTAIFFLVVAASPGLHWHATGMTAATLMFIALFFLFGSFQQPNPTSHLFHAFLSLGIGSVLLPQSILFAPVLWIGAYNFQSLTPRSFLASLLGLAFPYWLLLGYACAVGDMEVLYRPLHEMAGFRPLLFRVEPWEAGTLSYLFVLYVVATVHCLVTGLDDKIRTRCYLHFLILLAFCTFAYIALQPWMASLLTPLAAAVTSILAGHLFVLSNSRATNWFFLAMLALLPVLFIVNLWTLL